MALPYIETVTQNKYGYEGVLIDEERILGLEVRSLLFFCFDGDCVEMTFFVTQTSKEDEKSRLLLLIFTFKFSGE